MFEIVLGILMMYWLSGSILRIYLSEFENICYIGKDNTISKSRWREKFITLQLLKDKEMDSVNCKITDVFKSMNLLFIINNYIISYLRMRIINIYFI